MRGYKMILIFLYIAISTLACVEQDSKESVKHRQTILATEKPKIEKPNAELQEKQRLAPSIEYKTADPLIDLSSLLQNEKHLSVNSKSTDWPYTEWEYAKLFTFNFSAGESRTPWKKHRQDLRQEIAISKSQADIALALAHRMDGGGIFTKCPFDPHHAVVFYNQKEEEVAYINICFSCKDTILWPTYVPVETKKTPSLETEAAHEEAEKRFAEMEENRMEVLQKWQTFFSRLGADTFPQKP